VDTLVCLKKKKVSEKMMDKLCQDYAVDTEWLCYLRRSRNE
jgi:hypothetical protein